MLPENDLISVEASVLDNAQCGLEFQGVDYWILAGTGVLLPMAILILGWL